MCSYLSFWSMKMDLISGLCVPVVVLLRLVPSSQGGWDSCRAAGSWRVSENPIYNQIQNFLGERREGWIIGSYSICCYSLSPFCCPLVFNSRMLFCCLWIFWSLPNLMSLAGFSKHLNFRLSLTSDSSNFRIYFNLDFLAKAYNFKMWGGFNHSFGVVPS